MTGEKIYLLWLVLVWYGSCVLGTLVNARMMGYEFAFPITLTVIHLLVGAVVDWAWVLQRSVAMPMSKGVLLYSVPVAVALTVTKCFTFVSYAKVPASLTHTVRVRNARPPPHQLSTPLSRCDAAFL
jgi:hypothetical protein